MSVEVRAGWPCPHLVMEESVTLGEDRRTLQTRAPIGGAGSVRILVNSLQYVPSDGLNSAAVLTASRTGPYQISRCSGVNGPDANLLKITTGSGTANIRLPTGVRQTVATIQRTLRLSPANDLVSVSSSGGALSLTERNDTGHSSFIRVSERGAAALGFTQLGARGAQVYPAWELASREDVYPTTIPGVSIVKARYPKFRKPLRGNPTFKVTYAAMPERCPRCGGTYVENDYRFNPNGEIITIVNEDLLYQACLKAILTVQGSNSYHPAYGSKMTTRIGRKIVGASAALVKEDVTNALAKVQTLQSGQMRYQSVNSREMLYSIDTVDVRISTEDPTIFFVDVFVRNAAGKPVQLSTVFSVPGTIALAGSNNQPLGLEAAGLSRSQRQRLLLDG